MISQDSVLVQLFVSSSASESSTAPASPPGTARLLLGEAFLALVIMIVRRLHGVGELLAVLDEPTPEMRMVRDLLLEEGHFPIGALLRGA